jgi:hypothetical protein
MFDEKRNTILKSNGPGSKKASNTGPGSTK